MSTPTVFLSAASDDLKEWRDVLHKAFERAGCKVFTQGQSLGASAGDVLRLLRQHLDKSDFVIHLADLANGAEPEQPAFPERPDFRCSYTQFEYYYAHQQKKEVIAFVCAPDFPYLTFTEKGADDADRERRRQLQIQHRERVTKGRFTGTPLDGHPHRPLSEPIADVRALLTAVAAAVGTIRDAASGQVSAPVLAAAQEDLSRLAQSLCPVDLSRILKYAPAELIGRENELKLLRDAWHGRADLPVSLDAGAAQQRRPTKPKILTFVALGGEGKTSLVAKWAAELAHQDWPGCDAAFAWSFYSQGTREQLAASSDLFLKEALTFFGDDADKQFAASPAGAFEKGQRLARIVGRRRSLLILDGLEPLQYAPTSPTPGQLKDQGIAALLKGLAAASHGLCVVTTRYSVPDLKAFWQTTAPEVPLLRLSREAGVHLLKSFDVRGSDRKNIPFNNGKELLSEFEKLVEDVKGHALTLNLLGSYLREAHGGDIRKRDLIDFADADAANEHRHHVVHVMDAYVRWLSPSGVRAWIRRQFSQKERETQGEGKRALAVLRLVGLFDRPVTDGCFSALLKAPAISSLTEPLVELNDAQRNTVLKRLEDAKLLTANRDAAGVLVSLDAHPHLREYFSRQLRTQQPDAWRAAHRRLYEHLCATTKEGDQPTLEDLQPLYQAVAHGCQAGLQQEAWTTVYWERIARRREYYSTAKLGAYASDLSAIAHLFERQWDRLFPVLGSNARGPILMQASFFLRSMGRLLEALEPMRTSVKQNVSHGDWLNATISAINLSELNVTIGALTDAVHAARQAIVFAKRTTDTTIHFDVGMTLNNALHQTGEGSRLLRAITDFSGIRDGGTLNELFLDQTTNFFYCDLQLAPTETAAWRTVLTLIPSDCNSSVPDSEMPVKQGAVLALKNAETEGRILHIALSHLTLGRIALYEGILTGASLDPCLSPLQRAVEELLNAGEATYLPHGLLTRAWLRFLTGARTGPESAQEDLDEAWEIAERGPMKLHMADIHLTRARLFGNPKPEARNPNETTTIAPSYPWESPAADLAAAAKLINDCGYHRRDEELADAKRAILGA